MKDVKKLINFNPSIAERSHLRKVHGVKFAEGRPTKCGLGYYPANKSRGGYSSTPIMVDREVVEVSPGDPSSHSEVAWLPD